MKPVLVFDVDGVLVDVSESYREAIRQTVESFTGFRPSRELIQDIKNEGGWNNDWKLSHRLVLEQGVSATYEEVVARFDRLFMGENGDGLIRRERWVAADGLLERLGARFQLAIFTSRHRYELDATLKRVGAEGLFAPIVTHELVTRHKPAPDGLLGIAAQCPGSELWYVGDTVDDGESARAAGVPFIGVVPRSNPRYREVVRLLQAAGARAVLDDINELESVLPSGARPSGSGAS